MGEADSKVSKAAWKALKGEGLEMVKYLKSSLDENSKFYVPLLISLIRTNFYV